jgi:hypothetical protein
VGAAALALYLGLISLRFWWHGLAFLLGLALFFAVVSIAAMQASPDPIAQQYDYSFNPGRVVGAWLAMLLYMLPVYGVARGARWLFHRR